MRAVGIYERMTGASPQDSSRAWLALARALYCRKLLGNAEHALTRALELEERAAAPDQGQVAEILASLTGVYVERSKLAAARSTADRARALLENDGSAPARTRTLLLNNVAMFYHHTGRPTDARRVLEKALAAARTLSVGRDQATVSVLINLATLCVEQRQYAAAIAHFGEAIKLVDGGGPIGEDRIRDFLDRYAGCLKKVGRKSEARVIGARAKLFPRGREGVTVGVTELRMR